MLNEDVWFEQNQALLLAMANTTFGRDLLCIQNLPSPIWKITKSSVHYLSQVQGDQAQCFADFRVGAKWANVIRTRWNEVNSYARYFLANHPAQESPLLRYALSVANLTLTAYPNPNPETTTVDGSVERSGVNENFATIRAGVGTGSYDTNANLLATYLQCSSTTNQFANIVRYASLFDTSSLTASASISAATQSVYVTAKTTTLTDSATLGPSAPASNTALANADYQNGFTVTTAYSSAVALSGVSTSAYQGFALNASGLAAISKTGITKFGLRSEADRANSAPTWASIQTAGLTIYHADQADITTDPKLEVTYTIPAAFIPRAIIIS